MANMKVEKTVYKKDDIEKAFDTSFTSFVDPIEEGNTDTVEELFRLYTKLYYEISIDGETNSHEYLVKESSKLVDIEKDLSDIQPLLDEISELRERILQLNQEMIELQTENINGNI